MNPLFPCGKLRLRIRNGFIIRGLDSLALRGFWLKVEMAAATIATACFVISMYFAGYFVVISTNFAIDDQMRMYLALATSFFVAGMVVLITLIVSLTVKKLL